MNNKQASRVQCSPALGIAGTIIAIGFVAYIYRQVIINTVVTALIAMGCIVGGIALIAFIASTVRWQVRRHREVPAPIDIDPEPAPAESDKEAITREADWLAGGVELAFSPDGKTLKVR